MPDESQKVTYVISFLGDFSPVMTHAEIVQFMYDLLEKGPQALWPPGNPRRYAAQQVLVTKANPAGPGDVV